MVTRKQWETIFSASEMLSQTNDSVIFRPLPEWRDEFQDNVYETLEWLSRPNRSYELMISEEPSVTHIKDQWYTQSWSPALYHVCDPQKLVSFRQRYESLYFSWRDPDATKNLVTASNYRQRMTSLKYSMWTVVGRDGYTENMIKNSEVKVNISKTDIPDYKKLEKTGITGFLHGSGMGYRWRCSKCVADMPKGLQAMLKLTAIGAPMKENNDFPF